MGVYRGLAPVIAVVVFVVIIIIAATFVFVTSKKAEPIEIVDYTTKTIAIESSYQNILNVKNTGPVALKSSDLAFYVDGALVQPDCDISYIQPNTSVQCSVKASCDSSVKISAPGNQETTKIDCGVSCPDNRNDSIVCDELNKQCGAIFDSCGAPRNCGNCVLGAQTCSNNVCIEITCSSNLTQCISGCKNIKNDPNNCGKCGNICKNQTCSNGICKSSTVSIGGGGGGGGGGGSSPSQPSCPSGQDMCSSCVDLKTSMNNCGSCGNVCSSTQTCSNGICNNLQTITLLYNEFSDFSSQTLILLSRIINAENYRVNITIRQNSTIIYDTSLSGSTLDYTTPIMSYGNYTIDYEVVNQNGTSLSPRVLNSSSIIIASNNNTVNLSSCNEVCNNINGCSCLSSCQSISINNSQTCGGASSTSAAGFDFENVNLTSCFESCSFATCSCPSSCRLKNISTLQNCGGFINQGLGNSETTGMRTNITLCSISCTDSDGCTCSSRECSVPLDTNITQNQDCGGKIQSKTSSTNDIRTELLSCTTSCSDQDGCICKANMCNIAFDENITNGQNCGGIACSIGLSICSNRCIDLRNDNNNCNICGNSCLITQSCISSLCVNNPSLNVSSPEEGQLISSNSLTLLFEALYSTNKKINISLDGSFIDNVSNTTTTYSLSSMSEGVRSINIEVVNEDNTSLNPRLNITRSFTVAVPSISIASPIEGLTVNTYSLNLEFSALNLINKKLNISLDNSFVANVSNTTTAYNLSSLSNGLHAVRIEIVNEDNTSLDPAISAERNFTVSCTDSRTDTQVCAPQCSGYKSDNCGAVRNCDVSACSQLETCTANVCVSGPYLSVSNPVEGYNSSINSLILQFSALNVINKKINISLDNSFIANVSNTTTSYNLMSLVNGLHKVNIEVVNEDNTSLNPRLNISRTFTVAVPSIYISSPIEGQKITTQTTTVLFSVSNANGKKINVTFNNTVKSQTSATSYTTPVLTNGQYNIRLEIVNEDNTSLNPIVQATRNFYVLNNESGLCLDRMDNDTDNACDYDGLGCFGDNATNTIRGDSDCILSVTNIAVNNSNPPQSSTIQVNCTSSAANVRSIGARINTSSASASCEFRSWSGSNAQFNCNVGSSGSKIVECFVDTDLVVVTSGQNKAIQINVQSSCTQTTCLAQGKNCGSISNGCGGTLDCGSCSTGQTCTNNVCGTCTPSCSGKCSGASDGCGGICGTCTSNCPATCSALALSGIAPGTVSSSAASIRTSSVTKDVATRYNPQINITGTRVYLKKFLLTLDNQPPVIMADLSDDFLFATQTRSWYRLPSLSIGDHTLKITTVNNVGVVTADSVSLVKALTIAPLQGGSTCKIDNDCESQICLPTSGTVCLSGQSCKCFDPSICSQIGTLSNPITCPARGCARTNDVVFSGACGPVFTKDQCTQTCTGSGPCKCPATGCALNDTVNLAPNSGVNTICGPILTSCNQACPSPGPCKCPKGCNLCPTLSESCNVAAGQTCGGGVCIPDCTNKCNGASDGCGGVCPQNCPSGSLCDKDNRCVSFCNNNQWDINKGETDIDCGGSCGKCGDGRYCNGQNSNCKSNICDPYTDKCITRDNNKQIISDCSQCTDPDGCNCLSTFCRSGVALVGPTVNYFATCGRYTDGSKTRMYYCANTCPDPNGCICPDYDAINMGCTVWGGESILQFQNCGGARVKSLVTYPDP